MPDAIAWFTRAAEQGHVEAQYHLGIALMHGAEPGPTRPQDWLQAASQRDEDATRKTTDLVFPHGITVEKDPVERPDGYPGRQPAERSRRARSLATYTGIVSASRKTMGKPSAGISLPPSTASLPRNPDSAISIIKVSGSLLTISSRPTGMRRLPTRKTQKPRLPWGSFI